MKNSIVISAEFFFKGQKLSPSMVVDLDVHLKSINSIESLYPLLAKSNNIDLYSYEYEILQVENLVFSDAKGLAEPFVNNGTFDIDAFERALQDEKIIGIVSNIAKTILSIDNLDDQPVLKTALIEAYKLGQQSSP
ncbi:MAG: hypothetical protein OEY06_13725 [Gammaproteobacteria bacterium]|nr:hypothetical protein [Gammaproteobacteria bacterium]